jgi:heterodisulfide reductase subunit A-like polyferredoxin
MTKWHDFFQTQGTAPPWPYAIDYEKEYEIDTDVLVVGGDIAGRWAAIGDSGKGLRVALVEKVDTV